MRLLYLAFLTTISLAVSACSSCGLFDRSAKCALQLFALAATIPIVYPVMAINDKMDKVEFEKKRAAGVVRYEALKIRVDSGELDALKECINLCEKLNGDWGLERSLKYKAARSLVALDTPLVPGELAPLIAQAYALIIYNYQDPKTFNSSYVSRGWEIAEKLRAPWADSEAQSIALLAQYVFVAHVLQSPDTLVDENLKNCVAGSVMPVHPTLSMSRVDLCVFGYASIRKIRYDALWGDPPPMSLYNQWLKDAESFHEVHQKTRAL
jgi:hypothetical protein